MKKFLFVCMILALVLGTSCKKKEVQSQSFPIASGITAMDEEQFVLTLVERNDVQNLQPGEAAVIVLDHRKVLSSSNVAVVVNIKSSWTYSDLLPVLKKIPLTSVWVAPKSGSWLLITSYEDFLKYESADRFLVLDPKPYFIKLKDSEYWVGHDGKLWKIR